MLREIKPALLASGAAACTETFDGGDACPSLCPVRPTAFRDTTIEAVVLDTTVGGFPSLGLSGALLLANRPDTLVTRGVLRSLGVAPARAAKLAALSYGPVVIAADSIFNRARLRAQD